MSQVVILAVSGGVDSVVMLHSFVKNDGFAICQGPSLSICDKDGPWQVIVAHVDHGIREESAADARFVQGLCEKYNCEFEVARFELGARASEAEARAARKKFFGSVLEKYGGILATAHHADDVFETQIINLLRGTSRRGVNPFSDTNIIRPLLHKTKAEIYEYAVKHGLEWVEDSTNQDDQYLRNRVRHYAIPKIDQDSKKILQDLFQKISNNDAEIMQQIYTITRSAIDKKDQIIIPLELVSNLATEIVAECVRVWLYQLRTDATKQQITKIQIDLVSRLMMNGEKTSRDIAGKLTYRSDGRHITICKK